LEQSYTTILELEEFAPAARQLGKMLNGVLSKQMMRAEHGEVEANLRKEGAEFLRLVYQGHLDARAASEEMLEGVTGADGRERTHRREGCQRTLATVFGKVTVSRIGYSTRGASSLFPMDAELNLPADEYSHGLRRLVMEESSKVSYDEVVTSIQRTTAGKVPKLQAEKLVTVAAGDFEEFYRKNQAQPVERTKDLLILSFDGKGVVMRTDSLREATKKAAERGRHKVRTRLSKGEKSNRKRMATVSTVYDMERNVRTPEQIMCSTDEQKRAEQKVPRARNKRVWASVERTAETVIGEAIEEALRRDPQKKRPWVVLIDGQGQQLRTTLACLNEYEVAGTTLILDFIHVLEYLWKAAYCFHQEGSEDAETWVRERALNVLNGKASNVAAGIRRSATLRGLSDSARKPADTCADYLLKYAPMMRYDQYLASGFPIATGVIEGACRHLIKDRLDITGARWSLQGAESILKLRSLRSSGDFESYWAYHKAQERSRNHERSYALRAEAG
jgi:hypothetical protein